MEGVFRRGLRELVDGLRQPEAWGEGLRGFHRGAVQDAQPLFRHLNTEDR